MKDMQTLNINNNKVILRLDLNVTIKDNVIVDDTKIRKSIKTIEYLLSTESNILIMSHLGKIKSEEDKANNSLKIVANRLEEVLNRPVVFVETTRGKALEESFINNRITLMENTRYEDYPNKLESSCDEELSKYWASLGDIFINDAFGTTHRKHASNAGIAKFLLHGYGFLIAEELKGLAPVVENPKHPFVVIMGGAKVDDKIKLIEKLLEECDYLLVGGGIANTFLAAAYFNIGTSLHSAEYVENVRALYNQYKEKIMIPIDVVTKEGENIKTISLEEMNDTASIYDIGPQTIQLYKQTLLSAATIFVNGTMGLYEEAEFKNGTAELYEALTHCRAKKIAGGGDAVASVNKLGYANTFDFLSTGGGATLEYISEKKLKCFEEQS